MWQGFQRAFAAGERGRSSFARTPHGLETWNSKYDGRHSPRGRTFRLLHRLQKRRPTLRAFYGQDLHWRMQCGRLFTLVE